MSEAQKEDAGKPSSGQAVNLKDFSALFASYGKFDVSKIESKISVQNILKWFQQAEIAKLNDEINDEFIADEYKKLFQEKTHITQTEFDSLLGTIADCKKLDKKVLLDKLVSAGEPKIANFQDETMYETKEAKKQFRELPTEKKEKLMAWKEKRQAVYEVFKDNCEPDTRPSTSDYDPIYKTVGQEDMYIAKNWLASKSLPEYNDNTLIIIKFPKQMQLSLRQFVEKIPKKEKLKLAVKKDQTLYLEFIINEELIYFLIHHNGLLNEAVETTTFP